jgi:hypothetical protein
MMPGEGTEITSNHVQIVASKVFDNGLCSHLPVLCYKQVIFPFVPFQYLRIYILIDQEDII